MCQPVPSYPASYVFLTISVDVTIISDHVTGFRLFCVMSDCHCLLPFHFIRPLPSSPPPLPVPCQALQRRPCCCEPGRPLPPPPSWSVAGVRGRGRCISLTVPGSPAELTSLDRAGGAGWATGSVHHGLCLKRDGMCYLHTAAPQMVQSQ